MSCAFPTLFPTGAGDFLAPRLHAVTIGNYFKHLMMYGDGEFAKHNRFRYFALNTEMRWRALQTGRIYRIFSIRSRSPINAGLLLKPGLHPRNQKEARGGRVYSKQLIEARGGV